MAKFDTLYDATEKEDKERRKPTVKARLQRQFQSAFDNATDEILDLETAIDKARDVSSYDIQAIVDAKVKIEKLKVAQAAISAEYTELFGEKLGR